MKHFLHFFLSGVFFLSGCSTQQTLDRFPASSPAKNLNLNGPYPESLTSKSELVKGKLKVFFNLPPHTNPGGVGLIPALETHIKQAKKSIKMAIFQFNHAGVFAALKEAAARKVKVQISTDLCYSNKSGYKEYFDDLKKQPNVLIVDDGTASCDMTFNHNKYMIFDDEIAWFGSFNPTNHGAVENVELAISLKDPDAVKILDLDFTQLMSGKSKVAKKGVYTVIQNGKREILSLDDKEITAIVAAGGAVSYPKAIVGENEFEFILSPKVKSLSRIVEEVYTSESEVLFSSFAIADAMLITSLISKHKGANVAPVLLLPHPGEKSGYIVRESGEKVLETEKVPGFIAQTKKDLNKTLKSAKNYLTPKGELKGVYRYFYPFGASVRPVKVEGIFNSKVIDAESTRDRMAAADVKLFKSRLNGELHNKLFLIDERVTIFGSHNFSQSAENINDELTVIVKSPRVTKFLKDEFYSKTKLFAVPSDEQISIPKLAITEIKSETKFKVKHANKMIDAGDYIELYNFGDENINLLGLRVDDRFFPDKQNEIFSFSSNPGFSGDLVGFTPAQEVGKAGTQIYAPSATVLKPKSVALIVGRYFHESYYLKQFEAKFKEKYNRAPKNTERPLLLTIGAYASMGLGDGASGLRARDKISLYHMDNFTVIDRFEFPEEQPTLDMVMSRETTETKLNTQFADKRRNARAESVRYYLNNQTELFDEYFGLAEGHSDPSEWGLVEENAQDPGLVSFGKRSISSQSDIVVIEGKIADSATNTFKDGFVVLEGDRIKQVIFGSKLPKELPSPVVKDVAIFPGMIDGHNHLKYNFFPLWVTNKFFNNRYEWPELGVYTKGIKEIYKKVYSEIPECQAIGNENDRNKCLAEERCHVLRFGEIKALLGGTTAIQGSTSFDDTTSDITFRGVTPYFIGAGSKRSLSKARMIENWLDECSIDGAQNLERLSFGGMDLIRSTAQEIGADAFGSQLLGTAKFQGSGATKIVNEYKNETAYKATDVSSWKEKTNAFYIHLGEGVDSSSKGEWELLQKLGLGLPQSVVIHGLAFKEAEIKTMAKQKVPLIWSPTSNALLYKDVARVDLAKKNQVLMGLGSDWSLSGTKSMLYELKVARKMSELKYPGILTSKDLWEMATINNARIARLENFIGKIGENFSADFFLVDKRLVKGKPSDTVLALRESDIHSTWVRGIPQTGELTELKRLNDELNLRLSVLDLKKIDSTSCETEVGFLTSEKNVKGLLKVVERYKKAMAGLNPKVKAQLNTEFSKVDGFCQEKESAAMVKAFEAVSL